MKWNDFLPRRLRLLRLWVIQLPAGCGHLRTPRSPAGTGRPALCCLALPEVRPVWRRLAERWQRPLPHQRPQGALWRHRGGRRALLRLPRQERVSLRRLLLPPVIHKDGQKSNHDQETEGHYLWSFDMWPRGAFTQNVLLLFNANWTEHRWSCKYILMCEYSEYPTSWTPSKQFDRINNYPSNLSKSRV